MRHIHDAMRAESEELVLALAALEPKADADELDLDLRAFARLLARRVGLRKGEEGAFCAVCHERFSGMVATFLPCAGFSTCPSFYHSECLLSWLKRQLSCPLCRRSFDAELGHHIGILGPAVRPQWRVRDSVVGDQALGAGVAGSIAAAFTFADDGGPSTTAASLGASNGASSAPADTSRLDDVWRGRRRRASSGLAEAATTGVRTGAPNRHPFAASRSTAALGWSCPGTSSWLVSAARLHPSLFLGASQGANIGADVGARPGADHRASPTVSSPGARSAPLPSSGAPGRRMRVVQEVRPSLFTPVRSLDLNTRRELERRVTALHRQQGQQRRA